MKWKGHVACLEKKRNYIQGFVVKPEGNRPLGRCRKGGKIIKMDLKEICEGMYSIDLAQDRNRCQAVGFCYREVFDWMNVNPMVVITYNHHILGVKG
jgi:hypothetical protein